MAGMKQHISMKQFEELSEEKQIWATFNMPDGFTIGSMIELLEWNDMQFYLVPDNAYSRRRYPKERLNKWTVQDGDYENAGISFNGDTLCDALWEAVKEKLK